MNLNTLWDQGNVLLLVTLLLLAGMSVISWYIIFWKTWSIRSEKRFLTIFQKQYMNRLDWPRYSIFQKAHGSVRWLVEESENLKPVLANYSPADRREILAMHLVQAIDLVRVQSDRGLTFLASIGSCAPFIGLFGTVWGIYGALIKIASEGNAGLAVVAGPMGDALVATAFGLFAAIPAVMAYNVFVRQNRLLIQDLRHIAEQMTIYLSLSPLQDHHPENVKLMREGY